MVRVIRLSVLGFCLGCVIGMMARPFDSSPDYGLVCAAFGYVAGVFGPKK